MSIHQLPFIDPDDDGDGDDTLSCGNGVPENWTQAAQDLAAEVGGDDLWRLTEIAIERGFFSTDELKRADIMYGMRKMRRALKAPDATGLPFAGQTTEKSKAGKPVWKQRVLWSYADYRLNVSQHLSLVEKNRHMALLLAGECSHRYGRSPLGDTLKEVA